MKSIDVFMSHDWETSRLAKLLAIMIVFNSRSAGLMVFFFPPKRLFDVLYTMFMFIYISL